MNLRHARVRSRSMRRTALTIGACGLVAAIGAAPASAVVTGSNNADELGGAITGGPVSGGVLNAAAGSDAPPEPFPLAISDSPLAGFPTAGPTYTIITSGDSSSADEPNTTPNESENLGFTFAPRGEAFDPATLGVPVNAPADATCLNFDYKFLSEEFPEFVNKGFNDAFIAELDSSTWFISGGVISAPNDFAAPKGDLVSVDTVGPTTVSEVNSAGTTYDAATGVLTTKATVPPGPHTLYLSVFDSGDSIFDSAAFVDNIRFTNEPPITCKPPDIFAGAVGVSFPTTKFLVSGKNVIVPMSCLLQLGITVNCDGTIKIKAKLPKLSGKAAARAKAKTVAKGAYSIPPASGAEVRLKLKKKAKKAFKATKKLKGKATVTNPSNGAVAKFKVVIKKK